MPPCDHAICRLQFKSRKRGHTAPQMRHAGKCAVLKWSIAGPSPLHSPPPSTNFQDAGRGPPLPLPSGRSPLLRQRLACSCQLPPSQGLQRDQAGHPGRAWPAASGGAGHRGASHARRSNSCGSTTGGAAQQQQRQWPAGRRRRGSGSGALPGSSADHGRALLCSARGKLCAA